MTDQNNETSKCCNNCANLGLNEDNTPCCACSDNDAWEPYGADIAEGKDE